MTDAKKITLATVKAFIRKNRAALHIASLSDFDGMTDCVETSADKSITPALSVETGRECSNNLGILGAWFVGGSRDYFRAVNVGGFSGFEVSNCCGSFQLLAKAA